MKKNIILVFCALLFVQLTTLLQAEDELTIKDNEDIQFTFSLPVNATLPLEKRIHLSVTIPKGFKSLQPVKDVPNRTFNEFALTTSSNPYAWDEIITTQTMIDKRVSAKAFVKSLSADITSAEPSTRIISKSDINKKGYQESTIIMSYTHMGRKEVMFARYLSGPYDCSGFQYTIALSDKMSEAAAIEKIKSFVNSSTSITNP